MALRPDDNLRKQPGSSEFDLPQDQDNICDMVSNLPIMAGTEVFNTYGERLSNASLLVRYGFMIDGNEWDSVHWTIDNLLSSLSSFSEGLDLVALWKSTPHLPGDTWTGSSLVYHHCSDSKDDLGSQGTSADWNILCLNSDGKISHRLWMFCALVVIHQRDRLRRSESQDIHEALTRLAIRQLELEARIFVEDDEDEVMSDDATSAEPDTEGPTRKPRYPLALAVDNDPPLVAHTQLWDTSPGDVVHLSRLVESICKCRLQKMDR